VRSWVLALCSWYGSPRRPCGKRTAEHILNDTGELKASNLLAVMMRLDVAVKCCAFRHPKIGFTLNRGFVTLLTDSS
jgi:hypothetical protein